MTYVLNFTTSLISFRINIRPVFAKGHVTENNIGSWTSFLNPFNFICDEDGTRGIKAMGFSFRFGIQDWFDFGIRIGARKPAQKSTGKEVLVHTSPGYHVRYNGPVGRRVELKDDVVCLCSYISSQFRGVICVCLNVSPLSASPSADLLPTSRPWIICACVSQKPPRLVEEDSTTLTSSPERDGPCSQFS